MLSASPAASIHLKGRSNASGNFQFHKSLWRPPLKQINETILTRKVTNPANLRTSHNPPRFVTLPHCKLCFSFLLFFFFLCFERMRVSTDGSTDKTVRRHTCNAPGWHQPSAAPVLRQSLFRFADSRPFVFPFAGRSSQKPRLAFELSPGATPLLSGCVYVLPGAHEIPRELSESSP